MPPYTEQERAQLWSIYWGLRTLARPTPTLRDARAHLWSILDRPEPPPGRPSRPAAEVRHLSLIGGEG